MGFLCVPPSVLRNSKLRLKSHPCMVTVGRPGNLSLPVYSRGCVNMAFSAIFIKVILKEIMSSFCCKSSGRTRQKGLHLRKILTSSFRVMLTNRTLKLKMLTVHVDRFSHFHRTCSSCRCSTSTFHFRSESLPGSPPLVTIAYMG